MGGRPNEAYIKGNREKTREPSWGTSDNKANTGAMAALQGIYYMIL